MEAGAPPVAEAISQQPGRRLRLMFVLRMATYGQTFEHLLRGLLARGHTLQVLTEGSKRSAARGGDLLLEELGARYRTTFSWSQMEKPRRDSWQPLAAMLRWSIDYLRFLEPEFEDAVGLQERARKAAPLLGFSMRWRPFRSRFVRHTLDRALLALEAALPLSEHACEVIDESDPDVMLVAPMVGLGEGQTDYLRAAKARGIPVVLPVASWDNLSNKGVIRDTPELTIVWNSTQVKEATELHGLPSERVVATGAHSFDHWFEWQPARDRREFLETVGLPQRPFLLYVCSSSFIAGRESDFIAEWLRRLRTNGRQELAEVGVLVRPHPQNVDMWREHELDDPWSVVWPCLGALPTTEQTKADYFDSIYHSAAVVGINTSALVETAIVGRGAFTVRTAAHRHSQEGTVHFAYLAGTNDDGVLRTADSWEEHLAQLADELRAPGAHRERIDRFVVDFVRPNGLEQAAAPLAVAAIEGVLDQPRIDRPSHGIIAGATIKALMLVSPPIALLSRWFRQSRLGLHIAAKRARRYRDIVGDESVTEKARNTAVKARAARVKRRRRVIGKLKKAGARGRKRIRRRRRVIGKLKKAGARGRKRIRRAAKARPVRATDASKPNDTTIRRRAGARHTDSSTP